MTRILMYISVSLMGYRVTDSRCLVLFVILTFVMGCYLASLPLDDGKAPLPKPSEVTAKSSNNSKKKRLAILVPFRDRFEELLEFVPYIYSFLEKQEIPFHIFVIQQKDSNRFNRASLINVGFLQTKADYDYIAMHDVDLLPLNDNLKYEYPENGPFHVSSPDTHPRYYYKTFIGGILLIKKEHFELVNGMSNNYWGWGLEDDEFYVRIKEAGLKVTRPSNITTGRDNTFRHMHDKTYRKRDMRKCFNQRDVTRRRDRHTGLHDVAYNIHSKHSVTIDGRELTVINVELVCNKDNTPWCQCPEPTKPKKT